MSRYNWKLAESDDKDQYTYLQSMDISIRDFQYGGIPLQYMLIKFLVIALKRQFG